MKRRDVQVLSQLAALRAERSAALLARKLAVLSELQRRDQALRQPSPLESDDLAHRIVADRHDIWRQGELAKLSVLLARAEAEAQPFRERHARDVARREVIGRLHKDI